DQVQYGTREKNRSDLSGFSYKLGLQYDAKIAEKMLLSAALSYKPKAKLTSNNQRKIATLARTSSGAESIVNEREIEIPNTEFHLPSDMRFGAGIGWPQKWFLGAEF